MKDYIEIINDSNEKRQVEVVSIFQLKDFASNYIIYKELDDSHYYLAKYHGTDIINLDTNISEEEYKLAEVIFKGVIEK